jgi:hypothetical protein
MLTTDKRLCIYPRGTEVAILPLVLSAGGKLETTTLLSNRVNSSSVFAALHTFGFRQVDPQWGVESLISLMRSIHFDIMGAHRTYWDFFVGFGLFFTIFLTFAAVLVWQLADLSRQTLAVLRGTAWALVVCFAAVTIVAFRYAFVVPIVFSILILLCLIAAAWLSAKPT